MFCIYKERIFLGRMSLVGSRGEARVCFSAQKECGFLLGMIKNVRKMIEKFIGTITVPLTMYQPLPAEERIKLTEKGLIAIIYYKAFNEELPEDPDEIQQKKIQAVIDAIQRAVSKN